VHPDQGDISPWYEEDMPGATAQQGVGIPIYRLNGKRFIAPGATGEDKRQVA
jgi:hypothetical protein